MITLKTLKEEKIEFLYWLIFFFVEMSACKSTSKLILMIEFKYPFYLSIFHLLWIQICLSGLIKNIIIISLIVVGSLILSSEHHSLVRSFRILWVNLGILDLVVFTVFFLWLFLWLFRNSFYIFSLNKLWLL